MAGRDPFEDFDLGEDDFERTIIEGDTPFRAGREVHLLPRGFPRDLA